MTKVKRVDWKKVYAIKKQTEERILKCKPELKNQSGIYVFHKIDELGFRKYYCGKAKKLISRLAQHFTEFDHIANSLKTYGLINENENGWNIEYFYCNENDLDQKETETVAHWHIDKGYMPYNINTGGTKGKKDIVPRITKGYQQGLENGYENARKDLQKWFKYLKVEPLKDGKLNERMLTRFNDFLKGE